MWKLGCLTIIIGMLLGIGGCLFFGKAVQRVVDQRHVANIRIETGAPRTAGPFMVDPGMKVRLETCAELQVPDSVMESITDRFEIVEFSAPANYKVMDDAGAIVHVGAGVLSGSTVVPDTTSPHRKSFDKTVRICHTSDTFEPPASGRIQVLLDIPAQDDDGNVLSNAKLSVLDRIPATAGRWALAGTLAVFVSTVLLVTGLIVFLVGLGNGGRKRRSGHRAATPPPPPPAQPTQSADSG